MEKSNWRKEKEAAKRERRELMWTLAFGAFALGYFAAHLAAYLVAN